MVRVQGVVVLEESLGPTVFGKQGGMLAVQDSLVGGGSAVDAAVAVVERVPAQPVAVLLLDVVRCRGSDADWCG